jgi:hypothetical protein
MNSLSYSIFYDFVIKQLNNYYLFNEGIELCKIYNKFWIQFYFDFFNGYSEWAKWLFDVNIPTLNEVFGLVNMVQDVDVIDTSIAGDKPNCRRERDKQHQYQQQHQHIHKHQHKQSKVENQIGLEIFH